MEPKIYPIIAASPLVTELIGTNPVRFFPWGEAPQGTDHPYVTYGTSDASPENYMDRTPDVDSIGTQIDVWGKTGDECLEVAYAVRDALEPHAHMTRFGNAARDPVTKSYRIILQFDVFVFR